MDPFARPVVTQHTVDKANQEKLNALLHSVSLAGGVTALNSALQAPGGRIVQAPLTSLVTGTEVTKTAGRFGHVSMTRMSFAMSFLPAPVGYVPAETYGLRPDFYQANLGKPPLAETLGFQPGPARMEVFRSREAADAILSRALGLQPQLLTVVGPDPIIPPGPINVTTAELAFLQKLPPSVSDASRIIDQLSRRRSDLIQSPTLQQQPPLLNEFSGPVSVPGGGPISSAVLAAALEDPFDGPVVMASTQPALVKPTNQKALSNVAAATGIRRDLATERLDP